MKISAAGPILTHKDISTALWHKNINTTHSGKKYCENSSYLWRKSHFTTIL